MMNEPVSTVMTKNLITASPDESLKVVHDIFRQKKIHHLPIVEDDKLVGLITTSDLVWLNKKFEEYNQVIIKDVMTTRLAKLNPSDKVGTACEIFLKNSFHALPIVDDDNNLVGLITSFDVLKYTFIKEYPNQEWDWLR